MLITRVGRYNFADGLIVAVVASEKDGGLVCGENLINVVTYIVLSFSIVAGNFNGLHVRSLDTGGTLMESSVGGIEVVVEVAVFIVGKTGAIS